MRREHILGLIVGIVTIFASLLTPSPAVPALVAAAPVVYRSTVPAAQGIRQVHNVKVHPLLPAHDRSRRLPTLEGYFSPRSRIRDPHHVLRLPLRGHHVLRPRDSGTCPVGWNCSDVGTPTTAGSQSLTGSTWTVTAVGGYLGGGAHIDQFHYVWQPAGTVVTMTAKLTSVAGYGNDDSLGGLMIRATTDPGSPYYAVEKTPSGLRVEYRLGQGMYNANLATAVTPPSPLYIKIERTQFTFKAYSSSDGGNWTLIPHSTLAIPMGSSVMAGMHATDNGCCTTTATFDAVTISTPTYDPVSSCPSPWNCADINNPALAGGQATIGGSTWALHGNGSGIGIDSNSYHVVYQTFNAPTVSISARITSLLDTTGASNAQGGLILQDGTIGNDRLYAVMRTQQGYIEVHIRTQAGDTVRHLCQGQNGWQTSACVNPTYTLPQYLKVERQNYSFVASTSFDGNSWTAIPGSRITIDMSTTDVGMMASGGGSPISTAVGFSNVSVTASGAAISKCPAPWHCGDILQPDWTPRGDQSGTGDMWALDGFGDLGPTPGIYDDFHYVRQPLRGFGTSAQVTDFRTSPNPQADQPKVGVMIRAGATSAYTAYYAAYFTSSGLSVQYRVGGSNQWHYTVQNYAVYAPAYVMVTADFTTYTSSNGAAWTVVPNSTPSRGTIDNIGPLSMGSAPIAGPFVTSGGCCLATASFAGTKLWANAPPGLNDTNSSSQSATTCSCADPVNTFTGGLSETYGDIAMPGRGAPVQFVRTYRSPNAALDSLLGFGWTANYAMALTTDGQGVYTVHEETGSSVSFYQIGTDFKAAPRILATMGSNVDGAGTMTLTRKNRVKYVFSTPTQSTPGQLQKIIDPNGYTTTLSYTSGRLSQVQDASGHTLTFNYSDTRSANLNHITGVTDSTGRTVSYAYDTAGNLTDSYDVGRADTGVGHTQYGYDANHRLQTITDPRGTIVTNIYDTANRVTVCEVTMASGNRTTGFAYTQNPDGSQLTTVTDPNNTVTTYTYTSGELTAKTAGFGTPQAATTQYSYDLATAKPIGVTDPNGHQWTYQWDSFGNLTKQIGPPTAGSTTTTNETTTIQYTPANSLFFTSMAVTDPSNVTSTYSDDAHGNLLSVSRPLTGGSQTATTTLTYGDGSHPGDVTQVTDANNHVTKFVYDANGNLISQTDPMGDVSTSTYDALGRVISAVSPNGAVPAGTRALAQPEKYTSTFTYDASGDPLTETDPLGNQTVYHYDADGNVVRVVDARLNTTSALYNEANELTSVIQPDGSSQTYTYDSNGNTLSRSMLSATSTVLRTLRYTYDPLNRAATAIDPDGRVMHYGYDANSNLTSLVDQMGRTTNYTYDELNAPLSIAYHDAATHDVAYTYSALGQRATMVDGTGTSTYIYDSLGRITKAVNGASQEVDYGYDLAGNLTTLTYPGSTQSNPLVVTRRFDAANRMTDVIDWIGAGNDTHFGYDANGNITNQTYPASTNGTNATFSYDTVDALKGITASRTAGANPFRWTFGYGRDQLSQVSSSTDRYPGMRHSYTYDLLNRLLQDKRSNGTSTNWTYDAADNLKTTQDTATGVSKTLSYDSHNDQLTGLVATGSQSQNVSFAYNNNGDRTSTTDVAANTVLNIYSYNQNDQLTSFTQGATSVTYAYGGDGLRTSKTVNSATEGFTWDIAEGMLLVIQDGTTWYITGPAEKRTGVNSPVLEMSMTVMLFSLLEMETAGWKQRVDTLSIRRRCTGQGEAMVTYAARGSLLANDLKKIEDSRVYPLAASEAVTELLAHSPRCSYSRGQEVLPAGDSTRSFCLVIEGAVGASLESPDDRHVALEDRAAGSIIEIGQSSAADNVLVARALADQTTVYVGSWEELETAVVPPDPAVSELVRVLHEGSDEREVVITRSRFRTFEQQIAAFLLEQMEACQDDVVGVKQTEIAGHIGATRETVCRILTGLGDRGLIAHLPYSRQYHVLDRAGLADCA